MERTASDLITNVDNFISSSSLIVPEEQSDTTENAGEIKPEKVIVDDSNAFKEVDENIPEAPPVPLVLEPDHPMMERFQAALKAHLLKQIDRLSNQIYEMDDEIKKKEREKEETGLALYSSQQEIYKQQKMLQECETTIENLMKERKALEESVQIKKDNRKEEINSLNTIKKKENELHAEFQKLSSLEKQMEKWEKEMEAELGVSQRVSEKTQYDKNKLIEEKRKMDMYLLRLMTAVSTCESEIRLLEGEIDVKLEEKEDLNQTLADAAADLHALVAEQKRLLTAWNSVVSTINFRNSVYNNLSKELNNCQEGFHALNAEILSYKRSAAEEMKKSEKLALLYTRFQRDLEKNEAVLRNLMEKKVATEDKLTTIAAMINRTEAECQISKAECKKTHAYIKNVKVGLEKLYQQKQYFEDKTFEFLQDQMLNDKSAIFLNKIIKETREKTRKQEFLIAENENKISQKFLEVEELKQITLRNNEIISEASKELAILEDELKSYEREMAKCQSETIKKQGILATLNRKIEKYEGKTVGSKGLSNPLLMRITELEKSNAEIQAKNEKLQSIWLMGQNNTVKLTQERNEQLKDISLLRRKVVLLEQKALKIDSQYEKEQKIESNLNKSINRLQKKLVVLSEIFMGKKDYKENLDKENNLAQAQYLQNLKDSELEQIRLKAEIKDLETNLEELAETMLAIQREILAWEKKIQLVIEAKTVIQKEKSSEGELGQMKAEIHRMEVRYTQLKKVQEKLITDLEQCVTRRDYICDTADAIERRQIRGYNTKVAFQKKIDEARQKNQALRKDHKKIEKLIRDTEEAQKQLKKAIKEKEATLIQMEEKAKKLDEDLEDGKLQKVQNLEMLIRRQKKCKSYESIKSGKYRMMYKCDEVLDNELKKNKSRNSDLISVMESLIEDFPAYRLELRKICNTFQAPPS